MCSRGITHHTSCASTGCFATLHRPGEREFGELGAEQLRRCFYYQPRQLPYLWREKKHKGVQDSKFQQKQGKHRVKLVNTASAQTCCGHLRPRHPDEILARNTPSWAWERIFRVTRLRPLFHVILRLWRSRVGVPTYSLSLFRGWGYTFCSPFFFLFSFSGDAA